MRHPEVRLAVWGTLLNGAWEFLQSPLFTDHARGWRYVLWTRLHCSGGDLLVLLGAFWITSAVFRSRSWWDRPRWGAVLLFVLLGLGYTAWSELYNTQIRGAWEYTAAMPLLFGLGVAPLLQWILLPPLALLLLRTSVPKRSPEMRTRITILVCTILLAGAALLSAQTPPPPPSAPPPPPAMEDHKMGDHKMGAQVQDEAMMADCKAMMEKHKAMMDDMKAMDAKLDALVRTMNETQGSKKADATAAVVTEMVAQRKAMSSMMESMQPMMMEHMAKHMQMGKESLEKCPMMMKIEEGGQKHH